MTSGTYLNQAIFTVMAYNRGWESPDFGRTHDRAYGGQAGPGAFDIAAIQYLYGANTNYHDDDDTYVLPEVNASGTAWHCIWDTGGIDEIVYNGELNTILDLRAATLDHSPIGGGAPSYAQSIFGGFTIANGVKIENATGGSGDDHIIGNGYANILTGADGNDLETGGEGGDTFVFNFDVGTQILWFREGIGLTGSANQRAWDLYDLQLDNWHDALVAHYGPDLDTSDTLIVAGSGKNAGTTFHFDNSFALATSVHGEGYDVLADFSEEDNLLFHGMSRSEFEQAHASGLLTVTAVSDDTVIGWGDGSITLQHKALTFESLLNEGHILFV